jgi:hypothetical protein
MPCSAHVVTGSQTCESQRSIQVTVASSLTPWDVLDELYSVQYLKQRTPEDIILENVCRGNIGMKIITILERIADAILYNFCLNIYMIHDLNFCLKLSK